ncbi:glycosyltransferase [Phycicoccus sp. BSK3Z-2]|uniref:Glycosyltransferase n=1 Tax=Phycicoccus avicenniae TaxID=2828860 RepID=A0A941I0C1_9MICO|nr:glycosyltransferase [Phycicoccus avicenniae]MBR7743932.1 glycosyltransferase [Phycicoccus avicenniae]
MTLAPTRPDAAPAPSAGVVAPRVVAVLVSRREPSGIGDVLEATLAQSQVPDAVLVVDRTGGRTAPTADSPEGETLEAVVAAVRDGHPVPVSVVPVERRRPVRTAVARAVADVPTEEGVTDLLWFLPVGAVPEPEALVRLVDAWRRSPSTGMVGPKHVDADAPHRLRALSIRTTRGGRLLSRPHPGEPDQGQYDATTDVLAVPFAGALVERDLLDRLRGWEPSFGDVGADLDLGWRVQASGRRVVAVPTSRVRSQPGVAVATATTAARRRAARRVALARAPWWSAPLLAVWIALTSVVAAVGLLLLKRPRAAVAELTALTSLDPVRGLRARWRTRHRSEVRRRDLGMLFEPRRAVLTGWADAVHHAVVPPQAPVGDAATDLNPRSWAGRVVRHPGVVAVLAALAVTVAAGRTLGLGVVTGLGSGLQGGELLGTRADAAALWHAWTDGWSGTGLGGPEQAGPASALLVAPSWLVAHLPLLPAPTSPGGLVVGLLVLLAMPVGALSAYLALRVAARRPWVRALGALAWACSAPAAAAVGQGRLGAVVALALLPGVAAGLWLVAARRSTATSAFATALGIATLGAFAPTLAALAVVVALLVCLVRGPLHTAVVVLVPSALLAPWVVPAGAAGWTGLVAGSGLADWGGTPVAPWRLALLDPGGVAAPLVWTSAALVVAGGLALAGTRAWRGAPSVLALLLPVQVALALVAPRVTLGTVPAGLDRAGEAVTPWAGTMLLPVVLVLVLALAHTLDRVPVAGRTAWRSTGGRVLVGTAVGTVLVSVGGVVVTGLGDTVDAWRDPRPAVAVDQAQGAFATRSLFVVPGDAGAAYRFVGREDAAVVRTLDTGARADDEVAGTVTDLLVAAPGSEDLAPATAADLLAIRGGQVPEVARRLDATTGLQRISPRDGWTLWRLAPVGERAEALVAPPRLRMETPDETRLVPTTGLHAATDTPVEVPEDATLVVAQPAAWAERAVVRVDGSVLTAVEGAASPTYELPPGEGRLTVDLPDPHGWSHLGQTLGFLVVGFLAIPFGRRESRVVEP